MKKLVFMFAAVAALAFASCGNKAATEEVVAEEVETEVVEEATTEEADTIDVEVEEAAEVAEETVAE